MSPTVSRLLLSIALIVALPAVWLASVAALYEWTRGRGPDKNLFLLAQPIVALPFAVVWSLIWRREVTWTKAKIIYTATSASLAIVPAGLVGMLVGSAAGDAYAIVSAGLVWLSLWIGATAIIWRDQPLEAVRRQGKSIGLGPHCPQCNYNLSGLHEARCPECGTQYTLDELFAAATPVGRLD